MRGKLIQSCIASVLVLFVSGELIAKSISIKSEQALIVKQAKKAKGKLNLFFIQSAKQAKLEIIKGSSGIYKLTLKNIDPEITYVSDRPNRVVGAMSINKFIANWKDTKVDSLADNPPNAGITALRLGHSKNQKANTFYFALSSPSYDKSKQAFTYIAYTLKKNTDLPRLIYFKNVTLFIDSSFCMSCAE